MINVAPHYCPLCRSTNVQLKFTKQQIRYYSCPDCGFVFSQPDQNYNLSNTITDFEPAYLDYFSEKKHDEKNHAALVQLLKKYKDLSNARIMDVGCGSGKFVRYLRRHGYTAFGLEPSSALFNTFLKNDQFFFQSSVHEFLKAHPADKFDVIIVADVLEHIEDPASFVFEISSMLLPDGILFISTPDTKSSFAKLAGKKWHYYNKYHLSLFSMSNLKDLAARHNLSSLASGYITRYQSLHYIFKYAFNFILHKKFGALSFLSRINVPINLYDNIYGVFKKNRDQTKMKCFGP